MKKKVNILIFVTFTIIVISSTIYYAVKLKIDDTQKKNDLFRSTTKSVFNDIRNKLLVVDQYLNGIHGFLKVNQNITKNQYSSYFNSLKIDEQNGGIQGLGFSLFIKKNDLEAHLKKMKMQYSKDYFIRPEGNREFYTSIIFLEPFTNRNLKALGYDMYTEKIRRKAMDLAKDSATTAMSGKVILVQESNIDKQFGFLIYKPLYKTNNIIPSIEERQNEFLGWVYSPIRMKDFLSNILNMRTELVNIRIYDESSEPSNLMYDSDSTDINETDFSSVQTLNIFNKNWVIQFKAKENLFIDFKEDQWSFIIIGLILSTILISILSYLLKSNKIYQKNNLENLKNFQKLFSNINESIIIINSYYQLIYYNSCFFESFDLLDSSDFSKSILDIINKNDISNFKKFIKELKLNINTTFNCTLIINNENYKIELKGSKLVDENDNLFTLIIRDLTNQVKYEEKLINDYYKFKNLNEFTNELLQIKDENLLYQCIADFLTIYLPKTIILFNTIEENGEISVFKSYAGVEKGLLTNLINIIGNNPINSRFQIKNKHKELLNTGKIEEFKNGLTDFTDNALPNIITKSIEKLINLKYIYTIGIKKDNILFASIHMLVCSDQRIFNVDFLEIVFNHIAVFLQNFNIEKELIENENKFSKIFHTNTSAASLAIYETNKFVLVNEAFCNLYKFKSDEVIGKTPFELGIINEEQRSILLNLLIKSDKYQNIEFEMSNKFGEKIYILFSTDVLEISNIKYRYIVAYNITERIKLENENKQTQLKLKIVSENTYDWEFWQDINGDFLYNSPSCERITGYKTDDFYSNKTLYLDIIIKEDLNRFLAHKMHVISDYSQDQLQFRIKRADGKIIWIDHICQPIYNENKSFIGIRGNNRDITDKKILEEKISETLNYNRSLIEASLDPLVTINQDGLITDVNTATEKITGKTRNELINTKFSDYFVNPVQAELGYKKVFTDGKVIDYPLEILSNNGKIIPVLYNATVYKNENNEVMGVFAAARDISELESIKEEVIAANQYNRRLIEASLDPFLAISVNGIISDVNSATEMILTLKRDKIIGKQFSKLFIQSENVEESLDDALTQGAIVDNRFDLILDDKNIKPILLNAAVYWDNSGNVNGLFITLKDIEELVEKEKKLNILNETKNKLFSIIAHDLRGPLGNFANLIDLIIQDYNEMPDEEILYFLQAMKTSSKGVFYLLENLLDWARTQNNRVIFYPDNCYLLEISNSSFVSLSGIMESKSIEIVNNIADDIIVFCDHSHISTIFRNLISNAIKFSHPQSKIILNASKTDNMIKVQIQDFGVGMDLEVSRNIFLNNTMFTTPGTNDEKGTGLGLALCKEFIEKNNGEIWVESELGIGSTFFFTLPIGKNE